MNLAKQESLFERRKETAEKDKAAEAAKKIPASPVVDPAAEETMAERADRKLDERPAPKAAAEPLVMAKPSSVAAPEAAAAAPAATPALPAAPAARPAPRSGKEMPSRAAGAKVATEDVAHKAEQPASQPAGSSYAGGRFVANAPTGGPAKAGKDMSGWMDSAHATELGAVQPRVQPPATPAATTPPAAATAPAMAGGEAVVEVKVLNGHDVSPAKQTHDLAIATGGTMAIASPRQQPAPAATRPSQAQTPSPSDQAGPAIQLVTRQRLGEGLNAQSESKAQGAGTPSAPAETQANQTDQLVTAQASAATQGKLQQRPPAGPTQEVSRSGLANQQLRQSTSQNAAARVQRLLITVNLRNDGQSGEPRPKAAAKTQTQDQRPDTKN
jgi:hypothetical protein